MGRLVFEFYNGSMKSWLHGNEIEMYLKQQQGKSVIARFIRTLKNKIFKHMTAIWKNVKLNKYNKTYPRTIKIQPADA